MDMKNFVELCIKIKNANFINAHSAAGRIFDRAALQNDAGSKKFKFKFQKPRAVAINDGTLIFNALFDKRGMMTEAVYYVPLKTSGGTVYCIKNKMIDANAMPSYTCFTSHVFDRYVQRYADADINRKQALLEFFGTYINTIPLNDYNNESALMFLENGLVLGEEQENENVRVTLYNTYVTIDMLRPNQKKQLINSLNSLEKFYDSVKDNIEFNSDSAMRTRLKMMHSIINRWKIAANELVDPT